MNKSALHSCRVLHAEIRRARICTTYHFSVTWPFWTRFMLKPTVGIELQAPSAWCAAHICPGHRLGAPVYDLLDRELAALYHRISIRNTSAARRRPGRLTASTRSSDVLPAFWRPIMVMSISVFLHGASARHQHSGRQYEAI